MAGNRFGDVIEGTEGAFFMAFALLTPCLRPWRTRRGATGAELRSPFPGDDLVPHSRWGWTHAVTIEAPAAGVWPWVVQIGQGRGGFYSYQFLENLVGSNIHNADNIIPELQNLKVGDTISLHPKMPGLPVAILEPGRAIVLHVKTESLTGDESGEVKPRNYFAATWLFFVGEVDKRTTRLISRWRADYSPSLANRLGYGPWFVEPIGFVMDRKMLLGIKQRAEATASV